MVPADDEVIVEEILEVDWLDVVELLLEDKTGGTVVVSPLVVVLAPVVRVVVLAGLDVADKGTDVEAGEPEAIVFEEAVTLDSVELGAVEGRFVDDEDITPVELVDEATG
jgi:hypothetical protein